MSFENGTIFKGTSCSNHHFSGAMLAFGGVFFLCYGDLTSENENSNGFEMTCNLHFNFARRDEKYPSHDASGK